MNTSPLAVVIGAGGMGAAIAATFSRGHGVLVVDRIEERAHDLAAILRAQGRVAAGAGCDVTNAAAVEALASLIRARGGFNVLSHVAGLSPSMGSFKTIVRVNLLGPARVVEALLPLARPGAAAILISSVGAHLTTVGPTVADVLRRSARSEDIADKLRAAIGNDAATPDLAYQLSKYGVLMLCRREAARWADHQARILSVSPGMIATPMGGQEFERNAAKRRLFELSPLKREGTLEEVTEVIEFLASDRAAFITGTDILIDGGLAGAISDVPFGGAAPVPGAERHG